MTKPSKSTSSTDRRNVRSVDAIINDLHKVERNSIFDKGDLLLELQSSCSHGEWLPRLKEEFDWPPATAYRHINVAKLASKFPKLRNLRLCATTLHDLTEENEEDQEAIIEELAKHATKARLNRDDAGRVIEIGKGRRRYGDHPDVTLLKLLELEDYSDRPWHEKVVAAFLEHEPTTDDQAQAIVDKIAQEHIAEAKDGAEQIQPTPDDTPPEPLPTTSSMTSWTAPSETSTKNGEGSSPPVTPETQTEKTVAELGDGAADHAEAKTHSEHVPHFADQSEELSASDLIVSFVSDFEGRVIDAMKPLDPDQCTQLIAALRAEIDVIELAIADASRETDIAAAQTGMRDELPAKPPLADSDGQSIPAFLWRAS